MPRYPSPPPISRKRKIVVSLHKPPKEAAQKTTTEEVVVVQQAILQVPLPTPPSPQLVPQVQAQEAEEESATASSVLQAMEQTSYVSSPSSASSTGIVTPPSTPPQVSTKKRSTEVMEKKKSQSPLAPVSLQRSLSNSSVSSTTSSHSSATSSSDEEEEEEKTQNKRSNLRINIINDSNNHKKSKRYIKRYDDNDDERLTTTTTNSSSSSSSPLAFNDLFSAFMKQVAPAIVGDTASSEREQKPKKNYHQVTKVSKTHNNEKSYSAVVVFARHFTPTSASSPIIRDLQQRHQFEIFDYSQALGLAATKTMLSNAEQKTCIKMMTQLEENLLGPKAMLVRFYHWMMQHKKKQQQHFAIINVSPFAGDNCLSQLYDLGATKYHTSISTQSLLAPNFCWSRSEQLYMRLESFYANHLHAMLCAQDDRQSVHALEPRILPRTGWSNMGPNLVIVMLTKGEDAYLQTLINRGCAVYNDMWRYDIATRTLLEDVYEDQNLLESKTQLLVSRVRHLAINVSQSYLAAEHFREWWNINSQPNGNNNGKKKTIQAVLCGLDAVFDANNIMQLQRWGAVVFAKAKSLHACHVPIDYIYKDDQDLDGIYTHLFKHASTHFTPPLSSSSSSSF